MFVDHRQSPDMVFAHSMECVLGETIVIAADGGLAAAFANSVGKCAWWVSCRSVGRMLERERVHPHFQARMNPSVGLQRSGGVNRPRAPCALLLTSR